MHFANHLKTAFLLGALLGLCMLVGQLVSGPTGMLIGLLVGGLGNLVAFFFSDKIALGAMQARPVEDGELPWLTEMVRELAGQAGLPMPRVFVCPQDAPNAFATGRNPRHAAVAVTQGLLRNFPRDEIRGVMAHELAHIKHRDVLITTMAAILAGVISYAGYALMFPGGGQSEDRGGGSLPGALAAALLAPVAALLIQLALSRSREYAADAYAGQLSGAPPAAGLSPAAFAWAEATFANRRAPGIPRPVRCAAGVSGRSLRCTLQHTPAGRETHCGFAGDVRRVRGTARRCAVNAPPPGRGARTL